MRSHNCKLSYATVLQISCPSNNAPFGVAYSSAFTTAGGTGPFTYSAAPGSLPPPGLTLNPTTGAVTGTPTTPGSYGFAAIATDSSGHTSNTPTCPVAGTSDT